jgi:phage terminase large subunit-like protein
LTETEARELLELTLAYQRLTEREKLYSYYPDTGPLRRELYVKHLEFFRLGAKFKQRLALCANRIGKTEGMGGYETTCHLTGIYPSWWEGHRFTKPITAWVAGETAKDVRDSVQVKLCGPMSDLGTGLIPADNIGRHTAKSGVPDAIDTLYVKHASGKLSSIAFKSYDQGRESFQAADVDLLWLDEEPSVSIYTEAVTRTMTTLGLVLLTFTPLLGMSETVLQFLPNGEIAERQDVTRAVLMATWQDAPHLTEEMKTAMLETYPPFQRDARSKGIPQLGSGAIYPVAESDVLCESFEIPEHWPRVFAMDVGWNRTAVAWLAIDRESQTAYLYSEHYRGQAEPSIHAEAVRARGEWIPGVIDPAARGRSQKDGEQLMQQYQDLGLNLTAADNAVEAGIYAVWQRLSGGRLKVFKTCQNWLSEYRLYRRDDKGRIVKSNDHLQDAVRYGLMSGLDIAITKPAPFVDDIVFARDFA